MCTSIGTEAQALPVLHRQTTALCAESDDDTRVEIIDDAVAALERAAAVLKVGALFEEWGTLDIKTGIDLYQEVRRFETRLIKHAMQEAGGSLARAARLLGLNKTTLYEKIKRYGIGKQQAVDTSSRQAS
jgi:DNA-binding NtrC family response regulator